MKKLIVQIALLLLISDISIAFAQEEKIDLEAINKIQSEGLSNSKVMDIAFYLTDVCGPRLSNSTALKNAQNWAMEQLKGWGLSNVQKEAWGDFGNGWEIEKSYIAMTKPYYQALIGTPRAWTNGAKVKGAVTLVKFNSDSDLAQYKGKLKGKIVMMDLSSNLQAGFEPDARRYTDEDLEKMASFPEVNPARRETYSAKALQEFRARASRTSKFRTLCQTEQAAMIISYARGNTGTYFTTNGAPYAYTLDSNTDIPEMEISAEHYLRMVRLLNANILVEVEIDTKTKLIKGDKQGYNVIAEIPGKDPNLKEEVVMLGAHLDSWFAATGATDNAAGSAVVLEAVRILQSLNIQPKRTIRVALWSSEEQGLYGSHGYVKKHFGDMKALLPEQKLISAYYNLDNGTGKIRGIYTQGNKAVRPIFEKWLEPFTNLGATTVTLSNAGGTDHLSFDAVNIPGFQFIQDEIDYGSRTHHSNMDTYERLLPDDLKQAAVIMAAFVYNTAMRNEQLPRKEIPADSSMAK